MCNKISHSPLDTATLLAYNYAVFFQLLWLLYWKFRKYASEIQEKFRRVEKLKLNEKMKFKPEKRRGEMVKVQVEKILLTGNCNM